MKAIRRHKYRAQPTVVDGIRFPSKAEAKRYCELKVLERAGKIVDLTLQPRFPLIVRGAKIGEYRADFEYREKPGMKRVIEDVKGMKTPLYAWKKKHVEAQYGIQIVEVRA